MKVSLIIAYYKNINSLNLILESLKLQSNLNFEVIIAEDDNDVATKNYVKEKSLTLPYTLMHVCQLEDKGFRKNQMLNEAISVSNGELIVFIDGDCIPHKHFIKEYLNNASEKKILFGRRVMLSKIVSDNLLNTINFKHLSFINLIKSKSKHIEEALYIPFGFALKKKALCGCNWGILKKHLVEVNGFDEDYQRAGVGEDVDIEWRLLQNGLTLKSLKFKAIVYHLYHVRTYSEDGVQNNYKMLKEKKDRNNIYCLNGLESHFTNIIS